MDSYEIGAVENDETYRWKDQDYTETDSQTLKQRVDNNEYDEYGREVTPGEIQNLPNDEELLIKTVTTVDTVIPPQLNQLQNQLQEKQGELRNINSDLRTQRQQRNETQEDIEGLQSQLQDLEQQQEDLLEQAQEARSQGNTQEALSLQGQAGALQSNQIAEINAEIGRTQQDLEAINQQINDLNQEKNNVQQEVQNIQTQIENLEPETVTIETLEDVIIICTTEFETYISGTYTPPGRNNPTRMIEGRGTKIMRVGARPPLQTRRNGNSNNFWDKVYSSIKNNVFRNPGASPEGEWIDLLIDTIRQKGAPGSQGVFTGSNWRWRFGPLKGSHDFPEQDDFQDTKNTECPDYVDLTMQ